MSNHTFKISATLEKDSFPQPTYPRHIWKKGVVNQLVCRFLPMPGIYLVNNCASIILDTPASQSGWIIYAKCQPGKYTSSNWAGGTIAHGSSSPCSEYSCTGVRLEACRAQHVSSLWMGEHLDLDRAFRLAIMLDWLSWRFRSHLHMSHLHTAASYIQAQQRD